MNFRRDTTDEQPDINLVPLIDVLLVILIFLAATTTFSRLHELEVSLPQANLDAVQPASLTLDVDRHGALLLNGQSLASASVDAIARTLQEAHAEAPDAALLVNADAQVAHQVIIQIMEAASLAGIPNIRFATEAHSP
ncbi:MAG TPA: biopolymer transporter ExbD [Burkholderiaceae bacterium]|nr:biopolymer transporter ExbD [Burkholderiaceae bacterium]